MEEIILVIFVFLLVGSSLILYALYGIKNKKIILFNYLFLGPRFWIEGLEYYKGKNVKYTAIFYILFGIFLIILGIIGTLGAIITFR